MRTVIWTDADGLKHRSIIRDSDPDLSAPMGIRKDCPDLRRIDWDGVLRDLHNALVEQGVTNWAEYQRHNIRGIILGALQRRLQTLYREVERDE
jgi:hypothetical protein